MNLQIMPRYFMYGLAVETDRPLPGLVPLNPVAPWADGVKVHLAKAEEFAHWPLASNVEGGARIFTSTSPNHPKDPNVQIDFFESVGLYRFLYGDGIVFLIRDKRNGPQVEAILPSDLRPLSSGTEVWGCWPGNLTLEDAAVYLLGPILGFILRLRGFVSLHASAAVIGANAVAFVGPGGSGKSTLAAALARTGYAILSDDVTALMEVDGRFQAIPGYPQVRLWRDSVKLLYGADDALPQLVPASDWWDKRYLDLNQPGLSFQRQHAPLACIYLLEPPDAAVKGARIKPLAPLEALPLLVANTYVNYALNRSMRAAEFEMLGRLLQKVPIKQLTLGTMSEDLAGIGRRIERDSGIFQR